MEEVKDYKELLKEEDRLKHSFVYMGKIRDATENNLLQKVLEMAKGHEIEEKEK